MGARFKPYHNLPNGGRCPTCGGALVRMIYGGDVICKDWRMHGERFGGHWFIVGPARMRWNHAR